MRHLAFLFLLLSVSAVKAQLPEVKTTQAEVVDALSKSLNNENWFIQKGNYTCIFRNTPVGINHAFERFAELKKKYKAIDCTEKDFISPTVKKVDGTLDYERLVYSIEMEKSEIDRSCVIPVGPVSVISLYSIGGRQSAWMIIVVPRE